MFFVCKNEKQILEKEFQDKEQEHTTLHAKAVEDAAQQKQDQEQGASVQHRLEIELRQELDQLRATQLYYQSEHWKQEQLATEQSELLLQARGAVEDMDSKLSHSSGMLTQLRKEFTAREGHLMLQLQQQKVTIADLQDREAHLARSVNRQAKRPSEEHALR